MTRLIALLLALALPAAAAQAQHVQRQNNIELSQAWMRASLAGVPNTAAYMTIQTTDGKPDRLLRAESPVAGKVELHTHLIENGVAKMREVPAIDVPAGGGAELKPGGLHVMLLGVKRALQDGERAPLTLVFERAGTVTLTVPVRKGMPGGHRH
ncbi:MAG: copper chaperone PCu(A)C [Candidatus Odyssella sp.]|nr:copper chaperone PCu(A)C [Candidatus Odyssella sp.]